MFRQATLLGISLRQQSRRRVLVLLTFGLLAALIAVISRRDLPHAVNEVGNFAIIIFIGVMRGLFGSVVQQQLLPEYREGVGRGLLSEFGILRPAPPVDPDDREPDEYEVSIRNAAHYRAYRYVALFSFVVLLIVMWFFDSPHPARQMIVLDSFLALLAIIFTLPQAIILWQQPDMAEEA